MSSWVAIQRQEAFLLYRRYLAMSLHFREGSDYDFTLYGGQTNATQSAFDKKIPHDVLKFINLNNKLKTRGISSEVDEFLFANARKDYMRIDQLLSQEAFWNHENWKKEFGSPEAFDTSVQLVLADAHATGTRFKGITEIACHLLRQYVARHEERFLEAVAWVLKKSSGDAIAAIKKECNDNIFLGLALQTTIKIQKMYSYLCII